MSIGTHNIILMVTHCSEGDYRYKAKCSNSLELNYTGSLSGWSHGCMKHSNIHTIYSVLSSVVVITNT